MKVDENEFFRQAALRICGSLDIGKALADCLAYVKDHLPASEMVLNQFDHHLGTVRTLAAVSVSGKALNLPTQTLPPRALPMLEKSFREWRLVKIYNELDRDVIDRLILPCHEVSEPSVMSMMLVVEGERLGSVALLAEGRGAFTGDHARLFALLREPFVIAMSNALRYEEVLRLKDMVDAENRELSREMLRGAEDEIVGAEYGLSGVMEMVRQVAPMGSPVMILGETGVGKEVIANAIHGMSPRRDAPFIKVNCGAIPESLLDSELFGHEKGAFTGAVSQKRGRFERAHKGTIFLDEIAELPPQAQVRLLRVLQHKEIERVGGTETVPVDVRIISATHRNLEQMVRDGRFREDLWYRLNLFPIMIPPLRQRTEDLPALVHHFIEKKSRELLIHTPPSLSIPGLEKLKAYPWPGNVRELENLIERELIRKRGASENDPLVMRNITVPLDRETPGVLPGTGPRPLSLEEAMRGHILSVLRTARGKIHGPGGAAELLGINPNTLRSRMKKLGIPFGGGSNPAR